MNIEALERLTQKVEAALSTIRSLRGENQNLQDQLQTAAQKAINLEGQIQQLESEKENLAQNLEMKSAESENLLLELQRKDEENAEIRRDRETRSIELVKVQETLREKEEKIQAASARLEQVMAALEQELGLQIPLAPRTPFSPGESTDLFGNALQG